VTLGLRPPTCWRNRPLHRQRVHESRACHGQCRTTPPARLMPFTATLTLQVASSRIAIRWIAPSAYAAASQSEASRIGSFLKAPHHAAAGAGAQPLLGWPMKIGHGSSACIRVDPRPIFRAEPTCAPRRATPVTSRVTAAAQPVTCSRRSSRTGPWASGRRGNCSRWLDNSPSTPRWCCRRTPSSCRSRP
jgi:hypothetical protein